MINFKNQKSYLMDTNITFDWSVRNFPRRNKRTTISFTRDSTDSLGSDESCSNDKFISLNV